MVKETAQVQPINSICYNTKNISYETKRVETATNVIPGRLVKRGTKDYQVVVADSGGSVVGWVGYEQTSKKYRPANISTAYAQNDEITIIHGPGIGVLARLASGQNVAKGKVLTYADDGELTGGTAGTDDIVAVADESVNASAGAANIMVRSRI